jgi:hypothetical protein
MRVSAKVFGAIGVLSAWCAIACGQATPVTAPSSTSATITALVVAGPSASSTNFQLNATAKAADGTSQDVTALARWEALEPSMVSISSTGWVTILALGTVDVRATYQSVSGSIAVHVTPPPPDRFQLTGVVREVQPTSKVIAGATVHVTAGPDIGMKATTDVNGVYVFPALTPGFAALETTSNGYELNSIGLSITNNGHVDIWLAPTPPKNVDGATATARCNDGSWSWAQTKAEACTSNGGMAYPVCPGMFCPNGSKR